MVRIRNPFITCMMLILIINICIIGEVEFLLMTLFQIYIAFGLLILWETWGDIWDSYKKSKKEDLE